jgi:Flp pilus assembly protein TadG
VTDGSAPDRGSPAASVDGGSAVVDFVLVGGLLTMLFVALLQFSLVLHVRNVLIDCATEGARYGALADRDAAAGADRTRELITADLSARYATGVDAAAVTQDGLTALRCRWRGCSASVG